MHCDNLRSLLRMGDLTSFGIIPGIRNYFIHGQTLANRMKPGLSLQVEKWLCFCYLLMFLLSKTDQLKLENLAQTTFRFSPVRYRAPRFICLHYFM
jgi:hypothetical protein